MACLDNLFKFRLVLPVRREGWWRGEALIVNKNCRRPDNFDNYRIKRDGRVEPVPPAPRGQSRVEASARLRFFDHPETLLDLYTINSLDPAPILEIFTKAESPKIISLVSMQERAVLDNSIKLFCNAYFRLFYRLCRMPFLVLSDTFSHSVFWKTRLK